MQDFGNRVHTRAADSNHMNFFGIENKFVGVENVFQNNYLQLIYNLIIHYFFKKINTYFRFYDIIIHSLIFNKEFLFICAVLRAPWLFRLNVISSNGGVQYLFTISYQFNERSEVVLPDYIIDCLNTLYEHNINAYLVGG